MIQHTSKMRWTVRSVVFVFSLFFLGVSTNPVLQDKSTLTILGLMAQDNNVCKFPPPEILTKPTIAPFLLPCDKQLPNIDESRMGQGLIGLRKYIDETGDYYPFLCMGVYDLSVQMCNSPVPLQALPKDPEAFNNLFGDSQSSPKDASFCTNNVITPYFGIQAVTAQGVGNEWVTILNENLANADSCNNLCIHKGKVRSICKMLVWGRKLIHDVSLSQTVGKSDKTSTTNTDPYRDSDEDQEGFQFTDTGDLEAKDTVPQDEMTQTADETPKTEQVTQTKTEEITPPKSEATLVKSEMKMTPEKSDIPPQKSEITPQKPEMTPQKSEAPPQKSEITSKSDIIPLKPELTSPKQTEPVIRPEKVTPKSSQEHHVSTSNKSEASNVKTAPTIVITPKSIISNEEKKPVVDKPQQSLNTTSTNSSSTQSTFIPSQSSSPSSPVIDPEVDIPQVATESNEPGYANQPDDGTSPLQDMGPGQEEEDDEDDLEPVDTFRHPKPSQKESPAIPDEPEESHFFRHNSFTDAEDSHFFAYFLTLSVICIAGYLVFHNKHKILALVLEGRQRGSRGRAGRRPSTSSYRKLDSTLEEAISSAAPRTNPHVIY